MNKCLLLVAFLVSLLWAQTDTGLILVKRSALPAAVLQQVDMQQKIETYGKWVGLGKEIGTAVREGLGALTDEADKFSKTKVGKFTMFMIAFKILGYPIIQLFVGMLLFVIFTPVFVISFFKNCMPVRYVAKTEGNVKTYDIRDPDENWIWGHVLVFFVFIIVEVAIIFLH